MEGSASPGWGFRVGFSGPAKRWTAHGGHGSVSLRPHHGQGLRSGGFEVAARGSGLVVLDGSRGEGGGQILRTALTLSMLTGRPFRMEKVRAKREKPGLRPQHLSAVRAAATLCGADVRGDEVGSVQLDFRPGEVEARDLELNIGTAGSTSLVLQTIGLPMAMRAEGPVRLSLVGGTFNPKAPSAAFLEHTWVRYLGMAGIKVSVAMPEAGFYPRGGGRLEAWIEPGQPRAITVIERGALVDLRGYAGVCRLPGHISTRMKQRVEESGLGMVGTEGVEVEAVEWAGISPGAACVLVARYEQVTTTAVAIGERGKPAEVVAAEVVAELKGYQEAAGAVDLHSADQLLVPLGLAEGRSVYTVTEVTEHLRTNAATVEAFLGRPIRVEEPDEAAGLPGRVVVG